MTHGNPDPEILARREICAWLRANGINPDHTPMDPRASLNEDGTLLTLQQKVRGPNGGDVRDPGSPNEAMRRTVTVPVLVAPSGLVAHWLAPCCTECGR